VTWCPARPLIICPSFVREVRRINPPSRHLQRGEDQSALLNQLRQRALASVDDPNTTLAIFEWSAEDGCAVDDWDAIAQGTPGLGWTVSHEAIWSSLLMDPPRCSGPR